MSQKLTKWIMLLALLVPMALVACGGETTPEVEEAINEVEEAAQAVGEAAEQAIQDAQEQAAEAQAEAEAEAEEAMAEGEDAMAEAEEMAEEAMAEAEETMEEGEEMAEEAMEEAEEAMEEMEPCAPAKDGEFADVDPRGQTVQWWHNHRGSREELLLEIVNRYNETNECGITIEALNQGSYNDIRNAVNASVAAGEVPATLIVGYQNDQAFYQLNDTLVDLDAYINDTYWGLTEAGKEDFFASFFNQSIHTEFDSQRLGFPPNRSMEMMFYNATWLEELGFDGPPTTPDEFREMACAGAEANGDGTGGYILRDDASAIAAWTFAFGGDVLNEAGDGYVYNGEATIEAMTFLKELYDDGCAYFYTEGFPNPEVAARRALFAQGSSSGIPFYVGDFETIAEEEGRDPDQVGVTAIPHTTDEPVQNVYGADVMIVQTTPEAQLAAWLFTKWFTEPENQADWVRASNYFPTRAGTVEFLGDYIEENPVWGQAAELLPYGTYEPQLISYQGTRDAATEAFNEIMQGADIEETLNELTETANELQAELMEEISEE